MKAIGKFILLDLSEFDAWLEAQKIVRRISLIQQHHTYIPSYKQFNGSNHFQLCQSMEQAHKEPQAILVYLVIQAIVVIQG